MEAENPSKIAIIAAMHGDETYGVDLYNYFIDRYPFLSHHVELFIGNVKAYDEKRRFIDKDMNRSFSDSSDTHEASEIARLAGELERFSPDMILDIHTTKRDSGIFFISDNIDAKKLSIMNGFPAVDIYVMHEKIIKTSLLGNNDRVVSLEYSLASIDDKSTEDFCVNLANLILCQKPEYELIRKIFIIQKLISKSDYDRYTDLRNYDSKEEGIALMVPRGSAEMSASYYGFWCIEVSQP